MQVKGRCGGRGRGRAAALAWACTLWRKPFAAVVRALRRAWMDAAGGWEVGRNSPELEQRVLPGLPSGGGGGGSMKDTCLWRMGRREGGGGVQGKASYLGRLHHQQHPGTHDRVVPPPLPFHIAIHATPNHQATAQRHAQRLSKHTYVRLRARARKRAHAHTHIGRRAHLHLLAAPALPHHGTRRSAGAGAAWHEARPAARR